MIRKGLRYASGRFNFDERRTLLSLLEKSREIFFPPFGRRSYGRMGKMPTITSPFHPSPPFPREGRVKKPESLNGTFSIITYSVNNEKRR